MTIVLGYVPTEAGNAALSQAITEARLRKARLVVVNSSRGDAYGDPSYVGQRDMQALRRRLSEADIEYNVHQYVRGREGADEVLALARAENADLVVIGIRRRSPVGKLVTGSDAQRILLEADCPVLAVKAV